MELSTMTLTKRIIFKDKDLKPVYVTDEMAETIRQSKGAWLVIPDPRDVASGTFNQYPPIYDGIKSDIKRIEDTGHKERSELYSKLKWVDDYWRRHNWNEQPKSNYKEISPVSFRIEVEKRFGIDNTLDIKKEHREAIIGEIRYKSSKYKEINT